MMRWQEVFLRDFGSQPPESSAFDASEYKLSMAYNDRDGHVYMIRWSVEYSQVALTLNNDITFDETKSLFAIVPN